MRGTRLSRATTTAAAVYEFIDPAFLNNKRPLVPGGEWPIESLRRKSMSDLQQIWFLLIKERTMLLSTKEHYLKHQEELGAWPAPSRIKMVRASMDNIRHVMKERDREATDRAVAIFRQRLDQGIYRYPPGPQPPPQKATTTVTAKVLLSKKVSEERLRDLFGRFDEYEAHRGIVRVSLELHPEAMTKKEVAEQAWTAYVTELRDAEEYYKWQAQPSRYDYAEVETAPGVFEPIQPDEASHPAATASVRGDETVSDNAATSATQTASPAVVVAAELEVPPPVSEAPLPTNTVERLKFQARPEYERMPIQLGYFPNITMTKPRPQEALVRPVHPDEIEGPWVVRIEYDRMDGVEYAQSLGITSIDGATVLAIESDESNLTPKPYAASCPMYQEALRQENAAAQKLKLWPNVPKWKPQYNVWTRRSVADIVAYNYSNVVDYVDREVLLTGKSVWEMPIEIDYTCGQARSVPVHAERPVDVFPHSAQIVRKASRGGQS